MKVIATIQADLDTTSLGLRSRLADDLLTVPVLRRTIDRISRCRNVDAIHVLCPADQRTRCAALIRGTDARIQPYDSPPPSWAPLVQAARKWSLSGWRGGLGGTTHFDEFTDPGLLAALTDGCDADAVLSIPAAAVLIDPTLADEMIDHHHDKSDDSKLTFAQSPPGLTGLVLDRGIICELAQSNIPVGWVFSYKPDSPQKDLVFQPCCIEVPVDVRYASGRLVADTDRSVAAITELLRTHADPTAVTIGRWLRSREAEYVDPLPREVEIELTTDNPYPNAVLRPGRRLVEPRGPLDAGRIREVIAELRAMNDSLVVLGGFGDPLRHHRFADVLTAVRSTQQTVENLYGLAVRTAGVDLTDTHIDALIAHDVDVLNVLLDAWTPQTYAALQSPTAPEDADLTRVLNRVDRVAERRSSDVTVKPIVVPELTKARQNVHELDAFHDGWLRRVGAVTIAGCSHYAGQCPDHSTIRMAPSPRGACRRLMSRCLILADGRVTLCDQDFNGRHAVGHIAEASLGDIWRGAGLDRIRRAHMQGRFDPTPLCTACEEWHRP